jgi:hypothetical protein
MNDIYRKVQGESGKTFYIPVNDHPGDGIHVTSNDKNGYNGHVLEFTLEDGTVDKVKGPYNVSPYILFLETGIDLSEQHEYKFICYDNYNGKVLFESDRKIGSPFRDGFIDDLARDYPDARYIHVSGYGGGHAKYVNQKKS